ncbi:MAG: hypothetical protein NTV51_12630 [Verrucomicrobia bacterium]|nr:hypothetical protein [Verrucomicrobiota bacterium]
MKLFLDTASRQLTPAGVAPNLPRGGADNVFLQFLTANVAALLPGGAPIALRFYLPSDLGNPIATFNAFTASPADLGYVAAVDTLSGGLAVLDRATLFARLSYGTPNVDSEWFLVNYGVGTSGSGAPATQIVLSTPAGPVNYVQPIGQFGGRIGVNQTEGFWRVKAACNLLGLQISAQDAPTGANLLVEVVKGGVASGKVATLTAAQKSEETVFGAPLALAIGDVVQFKVTQVGSTKAGSNLDVKGIVTLL